MQSIVKGLAAIFEPVIGMTCPSFDWTVLKLIKVLIDFPNEDVFSVHTEVYLQILIMLASKVWLYNLSNFRSQSEIER